MQRINSNKGITLISLVVTIIVLSIILSITIKYSVSTIYEVKNEKMESELSLVQEAIMQQYALAKSENKLGIIADKINSDTSLTYDSNRPSELVGTRIADSGTITNQISGISENPLIKYTKNQADLTYEKYYYSLNQADLITIGIEKDDTTDTSDTTIKYIVNYLTGEVFDIENKTYYITDYNDSEDSIYLQGTNSSINSKEYNFSDDEN
jgi:type II secretory pathway pseudopilin PulG